MKSELVFHTAVAEAQAAAQLPNTSRKRLGSPLGSRIFDEESRATILRESPTNMMQIQQQQQSGLIEYRLNEGNNSRKKQRNRLIAFGSVVLALNVLLWFSVYQRHSIFGPQENADAPKQPWMLCWVSCEKRRWWN
jgi:hypothetical protein